MELKPKSFGPIFAFYDGSEKIRFARHDPTKITPYPPSQTPVDTLLASLAHCIVKSVEWAAGRQGALLSCFSVKVTGAKAPDLPGRVEKMHIVIIGPLVDNSTLEQEILTQAKLICTVSNTLNCEVTIATDQVLDV